MLDIHEAILVSKLESFKICKEVKHIYMIMIKLLASWFTFSILYLLWYVFDQHNRMNSTKYFQKSSAPHPLPPEKIHSPLKIQKMQGPPFLANNENCLQFSPPPAERMGELRTLWYAVCIWWGAPSRFGFAIQAELLQPNS